MISFLDMNISTSISLKTIVIRSQTGYIGFSLIIIRLIPVPGKGVGESVEFGGLLGSAPIMPVHTASATDFIARGGRIPAPMQSLKN